MGGHYLRSLVSLPTLAQLQPLAHFSPPCPYCPPLSRLEFQLQLQWERAEAPSSPDGERLRCYDDLEQLRAAFRAALDAFIVKVGRASMWRGGQSQSANQ